jgi:hypothetical protein
MAAIPKDPALPAALAAKLRATATATATAATPSIAGAILRQAAGTQKSPAARKRRTLFSDRLARGVAGIGADDPQREPQLLRVFLEAALIDEWGESLLLDPAFPQWVDRVQTELQDHPELRELAAAVCKVLGSGK